MELVVVAGRARVRASLLWLTVTAALAGLAAVTVPLARNLLVTPGPAFADALVQLCALCALVAGAFVWLAATDVARCVLRPGSAPRVRPVGPLRLALLAACGVSVLAGTAPAHAAAAGGDTPVGSGASLSAEALAGLPLPDRPDDPLQDSPTLTTTTVALGDSVWTVAARQLGPKASQAAVASYWLRVLALNADTLGADPDLVRPGQTLRLPPA
ncbi:LysM peptidoglycan-binding domain-containing protein [Nocardioides daeguensis]|uniref:LysM domain-containing protein n=1 Tax=Nocardioides daeguensis TaxID=908359 RepID=A0ABP6VVU7_9ACTN|nr:hypothetical protein [Nocardioides daeguensis]MBV6728389.1 hypothetical protein [Nocardioides daeguensis]MCR1773813.1 hypothetical protein [Nocardioides daeguensis]